jgi:predicted nuclease with TOPRIM domain
MDEHLEVLRAIWSEMKGLNGRVNTINERLDDLRRELKTEMGELRADFKTEVGELKTEMSVLRGDIDVVHRRSVDRDLHLGTSLTELSRDAADPRSRRACACREMSRPP